VVHLVCATATQIGRAMALPTLAKSWQYNVNQVLSMDGSNEICADKVCLALKNSLKGFTDYPWVPKGSSNGVSYNMTGTDLWTTVADVVHGNAGSAHSWLVLGQVGMSASFQLCIDCTLAFHTLNLIVSRVGFTGGTTTARPTATDEQVVSTAGVVVPSGINFQGVVHAMQSTDGACTRVVVCANNLVYSFLAFERLASPAAGWTAPHVVCADLFGTSTTRSSVYNATSRWYFRHNTTNYTGLPCTENYGAASASHLGSIFNTVPNEINGEWTMAPLGFGSAAVGVRGRHGYFYDMWDGADMATPGTTYPSDTDRQFVQFGCLIFPWNGSTPRIG
jgi:hypothetical protein